MFLRPYHRHKDGKEHTYYALVENERLANGPRQRTVAYLGELNHDQADRWQRTVVFYNRQGDAQQLRLFPDDEDVVLPDDPDIVRIRLKETGWTNARRFGDVWLAWQLWRMLHSNEIDQRQVRPNKHTCRPADIVAIEVINRLCGPCSEFALAERWYASTGLEDLLGVADADVTKSMRCNPRINSFSLDIMQGRLTVSKGTLTESDCGCVETACNFWCCLLKQRSSPKSQGK